jgi:antitoxin HigA-1
MIPKNRKPTHPGVILQKEFLEPMEITQVKFAEKLDIPLQRINEIIRGKRGITPETAWLFSKALGTSPEFWLNLQNNHDLFVSFPKVKISFIKQLARV